MKKCPYRFELVQKEALKCKHCNEWFDKENHLKKGVKNLFNSVNSKIETIKEERNKQKKAHLVIPTNENPMIFEGITFYGDRFKTDKEEIFYYQITNIDFHPSSSNAPPFSANYYLKFGIFYIDAKNEIETVELVNVEPKFILISASGCEGLAAFDSDLAIIKSDRISKKMLEQFNVVNNVLSKLTYRLRMVRYLHSISSFGYIQHYQIESVRHNKKSVYKFHSNGNVEQNDKLITNILTDYSKGEMLNLISGESYGTLNLNSINPFKFVLRNKYAKWYQIFEKKVIIQTSIDQDIFTPMIFNFVAEGKFPVRQIENNEN